MVGTQDPGRRDARSRQSASDRRTTVASRWLWVCYDHDPCRASINLHANGIFRLFRTMIATCRVVPRHRRRAVLPGSARWRVSLSLPG